MNTVEPIRDMDLVMDLADYLKSNNERDYVLFMFGIYTGLRISDILKFRVRDVKGKDAVYIREKKTGKEKRFPINSELRPVIDEYISGKRDFEYLFRSPNYQNKAITRQQAYNILSAQASRRTTSPPARRRLLPMRPRSVSSSMRSRQTLRRSSAMTHSLSWVTPTPSLRPAWP